MDRAGTPGIGRAGARRRSSPASPRARASRATRRRVESGARREPRRATSTPCSGGAGGCSTTASSGADAITRFVPESRGMRGTGGFKQPPRSRCGFLPMFASRAFVTVAAMPGKIVNRSCPRCSPSSSQWSSRASRSASRPATTATRTTTVTRTIATRRRRARGARVESRREAPRSRPARTRSSSSRASSATASRARAASRPTCRLRHRRQDADRGRADERSSTTASASRPTRRSRTCPCGARSSRGRRSRTSSPTSAPDCRPSPTPDPVPVPPDQGPVVAGEALYVRYGCINCHGPNGLGGVADPLSADKAIPPLSGQGFRNDFPDRQGDRRR